MNDGQRQRQARRCERGQVLPLLLVALVLAGVVGAGLVRVAVASSRRSGAQAAADAAALAGATEGEAGARRLAAANGATLVSYRQEGVEVEVVVERHGVTAGARARWNFGRPAQRRLRLKGPRPVCSPPCQPTVRDRPQGRLQLTSPARTRPEPA